MSLFDLSGRTALVTGANTGIGQAIAVSLSDAGARVLCAGRSSMAETLALTGERGSGVTLDLSDPMAAAAQFAEIAERERVDVLVNNAGIIRRADALDFSEADWDEVMDVNIKAVFFLSQAFARAALARKGQGRIINIASMLSYQGGIRVASYTSSKSGVMGLTRLLACEWAGKHINVNAIAPGYIATNNTQALRDDPDRNKAILDRIPAGRWGDPSDIGGAAVFLASEAAKYVHGTTLPVDGGWLAR
ncbi:2-dehydro-3-deoxy-D-gluconate 5-dehydrogenase KduD [Qingshengfaniella alkalisoli]|uniref:2-dehydro-3-deoxy-D-gluconate 5-dehydrogenase KduD n=1 Tax=Qingshengfaniella alkalisoli TaxID=2599296 RepID=A0A5B8IZ73_9RHOB|nr:2-dehydro-3-deoxy-D-gluconate 5-dehydrogenase KduD [Qingshengfaniella alkalisoli]QDY70873.1 2-dehydro-3-deoxy-D-gluconate 5-dehydrogenase KduD [Qingshengfaniella alkalisoli]